MNSMTTLNQMRKNHLNNLKQTKNNFLYLKCSKSEQLFREKLKEYCREYIVHLQPALDIVATWEL